MPPKTNQTNAAPVEVAPVHVPEVVPVPEVAPVQAAPVAPVNTTPDPMAQRPGESTLDYATRLQGIAAGLRQEANAQKVMTGDLGANIIGKIEGSILTLTIDLSKSQGRSKAGKSDIIASTRGGMDLGNGRGKLNLNLYR